MKTLNAVGEYVEFSSTTAVISRFSPIDKIFFSAQFFCVPRSDDLVPLPDNESFTLPECSKRNTSSQMTTYKVGSI